MDNDEDRLFQELYSDEAIVAAAREHEQACNLQETSTCPVCLFFTQLHQLSHMSLAFDPERILQLSINPAELISESMVLVQFLTAMTQVFADNLEFMEDEEDEDEEEE